MDDEERRQWVLNDEGLYNWYRSSRMSLKAFIKENRKELTDIINKALGNEPEDDRVFGGI